MLKVLGVKRLQLLFPKNGELVLLFRGGRVMRPPTPSAAGRIVLLGWPMAQLPPEPTATGLYELASSHSRPSVGHPGAASFLRETRGLGGSDLSILFYFPAIVCSV